MALLSFVVVVVVVTAIVVVVAAASLALPQKTHNFRFLWQKQ